MKNGRGLPGKDGVSNRMDFPKRGEIWLVSLEPVVGHEIGKTRPALVISNDRNNKFAEMRIPVRSITHSGDCDHLTGAKRRCPF